MMEPVTVGRQAPRAVAGFYYKVNRVPVRLGDAGVSRPAQSTTIQAMTLENNGVIRIVTAIAPLQGKSLLFIPNLDESKRIVWRCASQDIPAKYLPPECR